MGWSKEKKHRKMLPSIYIYIYIYIYPRRTNKEVERTFQESA